MNDFFFYSGVVFWVLLGLIGLIFILDELIEWFMSSMSFKKEFLSWYCDKLKREKNGNADSDQG